MPQKNRPDEVGTLIPRAIYNAFKRWCVRFKLYGVGTHANKPSLRGFWRAFNNEILDIVHRPTGEGLHADYVEVPEGMTVEEARKALQANQRPKSS